MSRIEVSRIREHLSERTSARLHVLEAFASIDSTNTYLMSQAAPPPGRFRVAVAGEQTKGRGRHNREWVSKQGAGLYLSFGYTFSSLPAHLPGLTLALGVGVVDALTSLGVDGVSLKWPNDIVARDGKLGGILTEIQSSSRAGAAVIAGIGLNLDLPDDLDIGQRAGWAHRPVDMKTLTRQPPATDELAGVIVESMYATHVGFEKNGFESFVDDWREHDWLLGRSVTVDTPERQISGTAAGVDHDGALLVETGGNRMRVVSGSVVLAGMQP